MASIGFSDIITISVNMNDGMGRSFYHPDLTTSHVCIDDTATAFDSSDGFQWETRSGSVYIRVVSGGNSDASTKLHFGIPVN